MSNQNQTSITVYLGKGEYALTSASVPKLIAAVKTYNETGKWIWKLVDFLGIRADGKYAKRFEDAKAVLAKVETDEAQELYQLLVNFQPRTDVIRTTRTNIAGPVDEMAKAIAVAQKEADKIAC